MNFKCDEGRGSRVEGRGDASRFTHHSSSLTPHPPSSQSAIALVIVMIAILVLAILAGGFAWSMKVETTLARNSNSEAELEWLGRSGVEYARWVLSFPKEPNKNYDSLDQAWATGHGSVGPTNNPVEVQNPVYLGNGSFTWKIVDLERKFNINLAVDPRNEGVARQILQQALTVMGADAGESPPLISAIMDWCDENDLVSLEGAESDYYQGSPMPYQAKNGPIDDLSELLLIRGISQEMYWGSSSTNHPQGTFQQRQNRFGAPIVPPSYSVGLADLFTPISSGRINLNTASAEVIQLLGVDNTMAEQIVSGRQGEDDGSGLLGPYRNPGDLQRVVPPTLIPPQVTQWGVFSSQCFEVQVTAQIGNYKREFNATLARINPRDVQILNFYWK